MARDWEATFAKWTERASDTEQSRYEWTRDHVRKALAESPGLRPYSSDVYAKGSYPNFTNVVRDSDVDIAAELTEMFDYQFVHGAADLTREDVGVVPYTGGYSLASFKDDVELALHNYFPAGAVTRGKKAIHIRESKQGLAADVVPCETHRQYYRRDGTYRTGILLRNDADPSQRIVNYPKQHLEEGTRKNNPTSRRYKRVVRILKRLENEMVDKRVIDVVPSFLIESAVWNVPNSAFDYSTWTARVRAALAHIFNGTLSSDCVSSEDWLEANNIKYLFHASQSWTYSQAHEFASEAWDYIGFD